MGPALERAQILPLSGRSGAYRQARIMLRLSTVQYSTVQYRVMHQAKMSMSRWPDQRLLFRICFLGDHVSRGFADQDQGEGASAPLGTFGEPCCLNRVISFFAWEFQ